MRAIHARSARGDADRVHMSNVSKTYRCAFLGARRSPRTVRLGWNGGPDGLDRVNGRSARRQKPSSKSHPSDHDWKFAPARFRKRTDSIDQKDPDSIAIVQSVREYRPQRTLTDATGSCRRSSVQTPVGANPFRGWRGWPESTSGQRWRRERDSNSECRAPGERPIGAVAPHRRIRTVFRCELSARDLARFGKILAKISLISAAQTVNH